MRWSWLILAFVAFSGHVFAGKLGSDPCVNSAPTLCKNYNISFLHNCGPKVVPTCIHRYWVDLTVPEDHDSVCQICLDMVKQARDQLESNQTQEDLKAVFEGSCELIPVKIIRNECMKLADEFIPDLVETLASQMNPQAVCTVAGLCNNAYYDKLLDEHVKIERSKDLLEGLEKCRNCNHVITKMETSFHSLGYEGVLYSFLRACGQLGSFSDSCSTMVFGHYEDIYSHLQDHFNPREVCVGTGSCAVLFHLHEGDLPEDSHPLSANLPAATDEQVCQFCESLVNHLRDIMVANTTEEEFKSVLLGLCKQSHNYKDECTALVDQYYSLIYNFLVSELNPSGVCFMAGLCKKGLNENYEGPIAPLLPPKSAELAVRIMNSPKLTVKHSVYVENRHRQNVRIMNPVSAQLPIERMMIQFPHSKELCTFCQYFLHYIQVTISDEKSEEKIKEAVENACKILPSSVEESCKDFVEQYGNAVIALLVQDIDPSQACPALTLCPKEHQVTNVELLMNSGNDDKPNCPLCLFAVEQLQSMLKNNKTEASIKNALDGLCTHLPAKLRPECLDFVDTYSKQLIEMLVADFTPQEVCVYLKLCKDNKPDVSSLKKTNAFDKFFASERKPVDANRHRKVENNNGLSEEAMIAKQIETNEIPDNTINGKPLVYAFVTKQSISPPVKDSQECKFCEFIMTQIEKELQDKKTEEEIKHIVTNICNILPDKMEAQCRDFITKYADTVIALLVDELSPHEVCSTLSLCKDQERKLKNNVLECAVCEETIDIVERLLRNPNIDRKIEHITEKACYTLPARYLDRCLKMMEIYGESILHLIGTLSNSGEVCTKLQLCNNQLARVQLITSESTKKPVLIGAEKCTWGPSYWCETEDQAHECGAISHCRERVWKDQAPPKKPTQLLGGKRCTWGPTYWCENEDQANECGAISHCRERVWKDQAPPKKATQLLGGKRCTWGPTYWCENEDQANECGAIEHCKQSVWFGEAPKKVEKRETHLLGAKKCSWGPSYWCENEDQANECRAIQHCREKVWKAESPQA